jgi:hypothetical protein
MVNDLRDNTIELSDTHLLVIDMLGMVTRITLTCIASIEFTPIRPRDTIQNFKFYSPVNSEYPTIIIEVRIDGSEDQLDSLAYLEMAFISQRVIRKLSRESDFIVSEVFEQVRVKR